MYVEALAATSKGLSWLLDLNGVTMSMRKVTVRGFEGVLVLRQCLLMDTVMKGFYAPQQVL
jgi:hypothetical protein